MPTEKFDGGTWMHPSRLPLGSGWRGFCTAATAHDAAPGDDQLTESCNLGYARNCSYLPADRASDAVRFAIVRDCESRIILRYVCEFNHAPAGHGTLEYQLAEGTWAQRHPDPRIQKMAECYLHSYTERTRGAVPPQKPALNER
jgi:hypothetical protein